MTSASSSSTFWRHARTLLTAQCSVAGSMLIGDTACQYIGRDTPTPPPSPPLHSPLPSLSFLSPHLPPLLSPDRSLTMLLTGFCISGPWSFLVLSASERLFPGTAMRQVLSKVAMNGLIAPVGISLAFTTIALLEGRGWERAKQKVQGDLGSTWLTGALYWPFISTLNFRFVPFQWRPLFSGMAGAVWSTYMSAQAHKIPHTDGATPMAEAQEDSKRTAPATTAIAVTAASS